MRLDPLLADLLVCAVVFFQYEVDWGMTIIAESEGISRGKEMIFLPSKEVTNNPKNIQINHPSTRT